MSTGAGGDIRPDEISAEIACAERRTSVLVITGSEIVSGGRSIAAIGACSLVGGSSEDKEKLIQSLQG